MVYLDKKIAKIARTSELKTEHDKIVKIQAFYFSYFCGKTNFEDDDTTIFFVFQPVYHSVRVSIRVSASL